MDLSYLLRGLILGFSIAAPVGPIGVLCIRRTLAEGRAAGFASGLGAATADVLYGSVAAFGLTFISGLLVARQGWLRLAGGSFLCYLGLKTLLSHPSETAAWAHGEGVLGAYTSTFLLTLANPMTILSFAAVFAGLDIATGARGMHASAALLVVGVFLGSALWWLLLSGSAGFLRARLSPGHLRIVNKVSGIIITGFGVAVLISLAG
jgi:threonine/homoserine/homoserine lactone efflux protein